MVGIIYVLEKLEKIGNYIVDYNITNYNFKQSLI